MSPSTILTIIIFSCIGIFGFFAFFTLRADRHSLLTERKAFIDGYSFPRSISEKVIAQYPHLTEQQASQVISGLREYFRLCHIADHKMVSMPSQVVDVAWHEFILFTKEYQLFCNQALGRFLHHTPAEAMKSPTKAQTGIKTAWKIACQREGVRPKTASQLPLLFAIDAKLNIPDGFKYSLNCMTPGSNKYCASHIGGCGSGCVGGCMGGSSGCGGGCGGGD